jgi:hypothetical protein
MSNQTPQRTVEVRNLADSFTRFFEAELVVSPAGKVVPA